MLDRFEQLVAPDAFSDEQRASLLEFFQTVQPACAADGGPVDDVPGGAVNGDLHPRDEYFLNNPVTVPTRPGC